MQNPLLSFVFLAALLTGVSVAAAADSPQGSRLEMMLPVVHFVRASDAGWTAVFGLVAEGGEFITLGSESLPAHDYPAFRSAEDKACWIQAEKVRALQKLVPKDAMHFHFCPRSIIWRGERWVQVHPPIVARAPTPDSAVDTRSWTAELAAAQRRINFMLKMHAFRAARLPESNDEHVG